MIEAAVAEKTAESSIENSAEINNSNFENNSPFSDSSRPNEVHRNIPELKNENSGIDKKVYNDSERPNDNGKIEQPALKNQSSESFNKTRHEVIDGKTHYYDDNDSLYRVDKDLLPDAEYEINGYKYKTDCEGRIVSAEGNLHLKDREGRLTIRDSIEDIGKGDQKDGDDRGHLIGDQFDGSNGLENMIPQDANINRNDFKNFENELAKSVKEGNTVDLKIEPIYDGDSKRPDAIVATYKINGEESIRVFPNNSEV